MLCINFIYRHCARLIVVLFSGLYLASCHSLEDFSNDAKGNFDAVWQFVDSRYCYFDEKDIDWDAVYLRYEPRAEACKTQQALFMVCEEMLNELKDGHVNLSSWFQTSYYRGWWADYPQNYDGRLVEQHYLNFHYKTLGSVYYDIISPANIGYLRIESFENGLGEGNWDAILNYFDTCNGIIIDIRDNGGGQLTNVETLARRFIDKPRTAGYMINKTGPTHNDFSRPFTYTYTPPADHRIWLKPVAILTNRSTFSAANNFAAFMAGLPTVTIVGDVTGGGGGMPISSEIPLGWSIRVSSCKVLDSNAKDIEQGISPTPGFKVDLDPVLALDGIDTMLEAAIKAINRN